MQRSYLRSLANSIPAIFQIGKNGLEPNSIRQFDEALEARELVKASVMRNSPLTAREAAERLAVELGADVIQVLATFVLYRESKRTRLYNFSKNLPGIRLWPLSGSTGKRACTHMFSSGHPVHTGFLPQCSSRA